MEWGIILIEVLNPWEDQAHLSTSRVIDITPENGTTLYPSVNSITF